MAEPAPVPQELAPGTPPSCSSIPPSALEDVALGLARVAHLLDSDERIDRNSPQRTGYRILSTAAYDAWLLHWPAGTSVTPHDHGESSGAFTVVRGELNETRWHGPLRRSRLTVPGEVIAIERGTVHDVSAGREPALSVHVYSPPLTSMGYYDETGEAQVDVQAVEADPAAMRAIGVRSVEPVTVDDRADTQRAARLLHPAGPATG